MNPLKVWKLSKERRESEIREAKRIRIRWKMNTIIVDIIKIKIYIKYQRARKRGRHVRRLKGLPKLKTIQPDQSNSKEYARRRWLFSKTLGKSCFVKMTGPAMVRPARSDLESDLNLVLIASQCTGPVQGDKARWSPIP